MAILEADIQIMASQVLDDVPEGGGAATGTAIVDGASNALFNDISHLDRTLGRVNLRKVFPKVLTPNNDGYFGAHVIVAEAPGDANVSVVLFSTGDEFDERLSAASRIESYLAQGAAYQGRLFGNHIQGQMTVTLIQRTNMPLPGISETLVLRKNEGLETQVEQYVRVTSVAAIESTFTDTDGTDFVRTVVSLGISDQLLADYPGFDAQKSDASINWAGKTKVYSTVVADAARYYGIVPLAETAAMGEFAVQADGIYAPLVPSGQVETALADVRMNGQAAALVGAGASLTQALTMAWTTSQAMHIGSGALPGSVSVVRGGVTVVDSGGVLTVDGVAVGSADYENGILTLSTNVYGTGAGTHTVTYTPAAAAAIVSESIGLKVTAEGQRLTYVVTLNPVPARGTLQVSYRALGRWYVLADDGSGAVRGGDSSLGAGTLNYTTGTLSLTLGALPDVGSQVIVGYAPSSMARKLSDEVAPPAGENLNRFRRVIKLARAIKPGAVSITWDDGVARTATDNPASSTLAGDASGRVFYADGRIEFSPNVFPPAGTEITVTVTDSVQTTDSVVTFGDGGSTWTGTLTGPLFPRTVELSVAASLPMRRFPGLDETTEISLRVTDNGSGVLQVANVTGNLDVGTINYSTGAFTLSKAVAGYKSVQSVWETKAPWSTDPSSQYVRLTGSETRTVGLTILAAPSGAVAAPVWAWWVGVQVDALEARYGTVDGAPVVTAVTPDQWFLPAGLGQVWVVSNLMPGNPYGDGGWGYQVSSFTLGGSRYVERAGSALVKDISPATGAGTTVGSVGFGPEGKGAYLTTWTAGVSTAVTTKEGAVSSPVGGAGTLMLVDSATFRTSTSPIKSGSFSVAGEFQNGSTFTAGADGSGYLASGTAVVGSTPGSFGVFGKIDYQFGVAEVRFGRRVPVSMAASPGVVDLSYMGIPGVSLVESMGVKADTLRYNAAAYSYLPLSSDLLGLNPVRLPSDGRVPIFRNGSIVVVHHTATTAPATVSNGQTVYVGRTLVARMRLIGDDDNTITTGYTTDLDAGTMTFTSVAGYSQPVRIEHRIEDMAMVLDAQISGLLRLNRPLGHDYPAGSFVSSALLIGDMRSRVSRVFDQTTWSLSNPVWSDALVGSEPAANFNHIDYPITTTNEGAVTERWALVFTSSSSFSVIGEHLGVIGTGNTASVCAPMNPAAGVPYLSVPALGWGDGWSVGNVLRINTVAAAKGVWVARVIKPSSPVITDTRFVLNVRGDVDAP